MVPLNIPAIYQEARRLRAEDLRRGEQVFAARMALYVSLFAGSLYSVLAVLSRALRPLFSWNPQAHRPHLS